MQPVQAIDDKNLWKDIDIKEDNHINKNPLKISYNHETKNQKQVRFWKVTR